MAYRVIWAPGGQVPTLLRHSLNHTAALALKARIKSVPDSEIIVEEYHPSIVDRIEYGRQYRIVNDYQGHRETIMAGLNKAAALFWLPSCERQFKGAKIEAYETARIEYHSDCDCAVVESRLIPNNAGEDADAVLSGKGLKAKVPEGMRVTAMGHFVPEGNKYTPGQFLPAIAGDKPVKLGYINTAHKVAGYTNFNVGVKSATLPKEIRPSQTAGILGEFVVRETNNGPLAFWRYAVGESGLRREYTYGALLAILRKSRVTAKQLRYYLSGLFVYKNRYGEYFYRLNRTNPGFKPLGDSQIKRITRDILG